VGQLVLLRRVEIEQIHVLLMTSGIWMFSL
jgi:hypothetical protein